MSLLDVQHIKKIYKTRFQGTQVEALKDIHFTVEKGEYVAIMGESGSGKSTLLNILAMLDQPTEGRVYLNGTDTSTIKNKDASSFRREKLGFVFQDFNLLDTLSVKDNILLPLVLSRRPVKEMMSKVDSVSRELGIHQLLEKYPYEISGGQKQRVAIAGIIALRPTIIILDEATSMLDPEGREDLMAVMRELQKKFQLTIISITHDLTEIALSDRTLVFQKGKLESSMTPRELFSRNDLNEIGLDKPFSKQVQESLSSHFPLKQDYLTESELLDQLWESL